MYTRACSFMSKKYDLSGFLKVKSNGVVMDLNMDSYLLPSR